MRWKVVNPLAIHIYNTKGANLMSKDIDRHRVSDPVKAGENTLIEERGQG